MFLTFVQLMKNIDFHNHRIWHFIENTFDFHNLFLNTFGAFAHRKKWSKINMFLISSSNKHTYFKVKYQKNLKICSNLMLRNGVSCVYFIVNLVSLACTGTYKINLSSLVIYTYWHIKNLVRQNICWGHYYNMVSVWY